MELQLLRYPKIANRNGPKFNYWHRRGKLSAGVPVKSSASTGNSVSPLIVTCDSVSEAETAVVVEKPPTKRRRFEVLVGNPAPFGATVRDGGVNFAVFSSNATAASLCLIALSDLDEVVYCSNCFYSVYIATVSKFVCCVNVNVVEMVRG